MRERLNLVVSGSRIDLETPGGDQVNANSMIKIGKLYDLVFTIAMKSCFHDIVRIHLAPVRYILPVRYVLMAGDKFMQEYLRSNTEGKDQQHYSA